MPSEEISIKDRIINSIFFSFVRPDSKWKYLKPFQNKVSGKWGYRLLYLHSTVISPKFEFTDYFTCLGCDKTIRVTSLDDLDEDFNCPTKVFKPKFEFFSNYSGIAYAKVKFGNKVGYIKQDGTYLIEPKFEEGNNSFDYDFAAVKLNNKWSFVNPNGSYLFALKFDDARNFTQEGYTEGFAPVKLNSKWGYLKTDGTYLIEPKFERAYCFNHRGYGAVLYNGEEKSVDSTGKILDIDYYNDNTWS